MPDTDDKELLKLTNEDIKQFIEELGVFTREFIKKKIEEKELSEMKRLLNKNSGV